MSDSNEPTGVNDELFDRFEALTFDDVVVVPGYSETLPDSVDTSATFAGDIELAVPLVSAAMDKVTEARMAIAMARHGGIGVIHRNMSIEAQAAEVQKVKRSQSGMITDPVTLPITAILDDAEALMNRFKFSVRQTSLNPPLRKSRHRSRPNWRKPMSNRMPKPIQISVDMAGMDPTLPI